MEQITYTEDITGLTIERVYEDGLDETLVLFFGDDKYFVMHAGLSFGSPWLDTGKDLSLPEKCCAGIITEDEFNKHHEKAEQMNAAREKEEELKLLAKLKNKYENGD